MTVSTNDIALSDLGEDGFGTSPTDHLRNGVALFARISMVELHDVKGKPLPAVHTGDVPKFR
jgi:hypothetical protein